MVLQSLWLQRLAAYTSRPASPDEPMGHMSPKFHMGMEAAAQVPVTLSKH